MARASTTKLTRVSARQSQSADDPDSFNHQFANVNGIRMHYVDEGQGPLVILLHGFPFLWYLWRHQIRALAAAGYRVVAPDQRGYGQSDRPGAITGYDITQLVGDVVGLMKALGEKSAVLVGQDWGSPVAYHASLTRPDLFRGVVMLSTPPQPRGIIRPSVGMRAVYKDLNFYVEHFGRPEAEREIMSNLRNFLLGIYYSTSGSCADEEQWRWAWQVDEKFSETYTVPDKLPAFLSQRALDYYVGEFTRSGIQPALNWYLAIDRGWEVSSFLDGAVVQQPALFIAGARDPALKPLFGIDRQGPALRALSAIFPDLREIVTLEGAGHAPPEEKPEEVNALLLKFMNDI